MVQVVLKWQNSTAFQSHIYESFVFKSGKGDWVTRINNPAKFGWDRISGGAPTLWWNIGVVCLLLLLWFCFFFPSHAYIPYPWTDSSKDAVWREDVPSKQVVFEILTFWGSFSPKPPKIGPAVGKSQPKRKGRITLKGLKIGKIHQ